MNTFINLHDSLSLIGEGYAGGFSFLTHSVKYFSLLASSSHNQKIKQKFPPLGSSFISITSTTVYMYYMETGAHY